MQCDGILDLMKKYIESTYKPIFNNPNETFCLQPLGFHWFNSTEKLALNQLEIINKVKFKLLFISKCFIHSSYICSVKIILNLHKSIYVLFLFEEKKCVSVVDF